MGIQFLLQLVLARILDPSHYGMLSIMIVFVSLSNVFIQHGFSAALIQNKDVTEDDYSSVFWVTIFITFVIYLILFITAPLIADFYSLPELIVPFRVITLMLFPGAVNSVQNARISRNLDYKKIFISNLGAIVIAGVAGIFVALSNGGVWALVVQNLVNVIASCLIMFFTVKLKIRLLIDFSRVKTLFSYSWKILASCLIESFFLNLRSLTVGKIFNETILGFYNRGKQFPEYAMTAINSSVQSVMLSAMSREQDQKERVKILARKTIRVGCYVLFPMMAGLAAVASPLIKVLLSEKWLPCVPYMQIYCIAMALMPIHSCNLQAINALGHSDIYLRLEIIKKIFLVAALVIAVVFFKSPLAIALTGAIAEILGLFINAFPNKKLINYSYKDQFKDITPFICLSIAMFIIVALMSLLHLSEPLLLVSQVVAGMVVYLSLSWVFKVPEFKMLKDYAINILKKFFR